MKTSVCLLLLILLSCKSISQSVSVEGKVVEANGKTPLIGASVIHKSSYNGVTTDSSGRFLIRVPKSDPVLVFSFIGYVKKQLRVQPSGALLVELQADENQLGEVTISSGYQSLPRERATGSFVQVESELLNRRVSTDITSRLADVVPGLIFNRSGSSRSGAQSAISIRGQSTLFAREDPLIVLDNFPYTGDLASINPNDVESITILRDAAAASIWGAQSGNGVIVITTKKGKLNQPARVSFNSSVTLAAKPDLFYLPQISTAQYIDLEKMLFEQGYFNSTETGDAKTALTPAVEIMIARRDGKITALQAESQLTALSNQDVRNDLQKYLYQNSVNQQYALSIRGGGSNQQYFISAGYDKNLSSSIGNSYGRFTINANNSYFLAKNKLELTSGIYYSAAKTTQNAVSTADMQISSGKAMPPYTHLVDESGNPAVITHIYRDSFIEQAAQKGLLDWTYSPLRDLALADNTTRLTDYRINANLCYNIIPGLVAQVLYQYGSSQNARRNRQDKNSWYSRDLINRFTIAGETALTRPVPVGDILSVNDVVSASQSLRTQLNFERDFKPNGNITALAGAEIRQLTNKGYSNLFYGYDDQLATSVQVDYLSGFASYVNPGLTGNRIPSNSGISDLTDRYLSYYANAAYHYKGCYTISASGRFDQSNLFGVKANQKGVPLYSAGGSWKISNESFYKSTWLPYLNLRATYGYNGNIDKSLSAYTTAQYLEASQSLNGVAYANILNPPNPSLRWERIRMINLGLDFKSRNSILSGSIEYYLKKGIDLIGNSPVAPQTGISSFKGNTANTKGRGLDINISSRNLNRAITWRTDFLLSYAADKVTRYLAKPTSIAGSYLTGGTLIPTEGKPLYAVYSYRWAGLDPVTGDPQGYLNHEVSKNYAAIKSATTLDQLVYNGTLRPLFFGALRNSFAYKGISLSVNISYRLGYVIRSPSVDYGSILSGKGGHGDYSLRWQKPGDELITHIPSMPPAMNVQRNEFYAYSSVLVKKGDHIRLQDISLRYDLGSLWHRGAVFQSAQIYLYANNIGILYKKAKGSFDPDALLSAPAARSLAAGVKVEF